MTAYLVTNGVEVCKVFDTFKEARDWLDSLHIDVLDRDVAFKLEITTKAKEKQQ